MENFIISICDGVRLENHVVISGKVLSPTELVQYFESRNYDDEEAFEFLEGLEIKSHSLKDVLPKDEDDRKRKILAKYK